VGSRLGASSRHGGHVWFPKKTVIEAAAGAAALITKGGMGVSTPILNDTIISLFYRHRILPTIIYQENPFYTDDPTGPEMN
jgi:hypothetical protein